MSKAIKVLVHGTGFAGQGHAEAFRDMGAEIVGIVGRTKTVVNRVASDLSIPYAGTDWNQALLKSKPDVISIGTPGGAHYDAIKQAIAMGCDVFCDKPLTTDGQKAFELYQLAEDAGVKTVRSRMHFAFQSRARYTLWLVPPQRRWRRAT